MTTAHRPERPMDTAPIELIQARWILEEMEMAKLDLVGKTKTDRARKRRDDIDRQLEKEIENLGMW